MSEEKNHRRFFGRIGNVFSWMKDINNRVRDYHNLDEKYKEEVNRANGLNIENQNLESTLKSSQESCAYLQRQKELAEGKLVLLQENQEHLKRDYEKLVVVMDEERIEMQTDVAYAQRGVEKKTNELLEMKQDVENALETCWNVRTGWDVLMDRLERDESQNKALNDFLEGPKGFLEKKVRIASEQSSVFQGFAFGGRVNTYINQNPKAKKIAMAFYDFENKEFYYNHAATNLLKFKSGESYLSLGGLLRIIENKEHECDNPKLNTKRKFLLSSLKSGDVLNDFEINTVGKKPIKVYLATRPIHYASKIVNVTEKKHFGILMFFNKPSRCLWGGKKEGKVYEQVQEVLDNLKKEFEHIYRAVEDIR